jgi:hypothetical protein
MPYDPALLKKLVYWGYQFTGKHKEGKTPTKRNKSPEAKSCNLRSL